MKLAVALSLLLMVGCTRHHIAPQLATRKCFDGSEPKSAPDKYTHQMLEYCPLYVDGKLYDVVSPMWRPGDTDEEDAAVNGKHKKKKDTD